MNCLNLVWTMTCSKCSHGRILVLPQLQADRQPHPHCPSQPWTEPCFATRPLPAHQVDTDTIEQLLGNTLNLNATLLIPPERNDLQSSSVSLMTVLIMLGLDPVMIDNPLPSRYLTLVLHSLIDICPARPALDTFLQDVTEEVNLINVGCRPNPTDR